MTTPWDEAPADIRLALYDEVVDLLALSTVDFNEKTDFTARQLWLLKELALRDDDGSFCDHCEMPHKETMMYFTHDDDTYSLCPEKETIDKMRIEWAVCVWCVQETKDYHNELKEVVA
jgi:hypothetical protein